MIEIIKRHWSIIGALIFMLIVILLSQGCSTASITKFNADYTAMVTTAKDFATLSAKDWEFGTGIIQGAIPSDLLPKWVTDDFDKIQAWIDAGELSDYQKGYILGVRIRMANPILKAIMEQYAKPLIGIPEVAAVLSFIGL